MLFLQKPKAATAGNNYLTFQLPVGAILKKVNVINASKEWQLITLQITEDEAGVGRGLSLVHRAPQAGTRDVSWEGEMMIEAPFIYVGALIFGCDLDDVLSLTIGYEMAPKKKGWWC